MSDDIQIREAEEQDIEGIIKLFKESYGEDYPYHYFLDQKWVKHSLYNDDILMLVAIDGIGNILGSASIVFSVGSDNDQAGEFGRLVVSPTARGKGIGKKLMLARIEHAKKRLHIGIVENRTVHTFSQKISIKHGFVPVGLLPQKHLFNQRESMSLYVQHFGEALKLRKNHPRIIGEAYQIAATALSACGLQNDLIVDDQSYAYHSDSQYELLHLKSESMPALLRMERGRLSHKEIFGPAQLQYGFFRLNAKKANYLMVKKDGHILGAIGYIHDKIEHSVKLFQLISIDEKPIRFLIESLIMHARNELEAQYIEADVSAYAPKMQKSLLELGFIPCGYIPAMAFHQVERLDILKMAKVMTCEKVQELNLLDKDGIPQMVLSKLNRQKILPQIERIIDQNPFFQGLNTEQARYLGSCFELKNTNSNSEILFKTGDQANELYLVLSGSLNILEDDQLVGVVLASEMVGECSFLSHQLRSKTAQISGETQLGVLTRKNFEQILRERPDIGQILYKNLAIGLGHKLGRVSYQVADPYFEKPINLM